MTGETVVREARLEDAVAFVRAYEVAWDSTVGAIVGKSLAELAPVEARREQFVSSLDKVSADARVWVAERSGEIVGVAVCVREDPEEVELRALYVVPSVWGKGVAKELMDAGLDSVRARAREAFLWVGDDNMRARRFYEREGWAADGASRVSALGPGELRYRRLLG